MLPSFGEAKFNRRSKSNRRALRKRKRVAAGRSSDTKKRFQTSNHTRKLSSSAGGPTEFNAYARHGRLRTQGGRLSAGYREIALCECPFCLYPAWGEWPFSDDRPTIPSATRNCLRRTKREETAHLRDCFGEFTHYCQWRGESTKMDVSEIWDAVSDGTQQLVDQYWDRRGFGFHLTDGPTSMEALFNASGLKIPEGTPRSVVMSLVMAVYFHAQIGIQCECMYCLARRDYKRHQEIGWWGPFPKLPEPLEFDKWTADAQNRVCKILSQEMRVLNILHERFTGGIVAELVFEFRKPDIPSDVFEIPEESFERGHHCKDCYFSALPLLSLGVLPCRKEDLPFGLATGAKFLEVEPCCWPGCVEVQNEDDTDCRVQFVASSPNQDIRNFDIESDFTVPAGAFRTIPLRLLPEDPSKFTIQYRAAASDGPWEQLPMPSRCPKTKEANLILKGEKLTVCLTPWLP